MDIIYCIPIAIAAGYNLAILKVHPSNLENPIAAWLGQVMLGSLAHSHQAVKSEEKK